MRFWGKTRLFIWLVISLLLILAPASWAAAQTETQAAAPDPSLEILESLDFSQVEETVKQMNQELGNYLPTTDWQQLLQDIRQGEVSWNLADILAGMGRFFFQEVLANSALLVQLIILAVICAVLQNMQSAFNEGQ